MRSGARNGRSIGSQAGAGRRRSGRHRHLHPYAEDLGERTQEAHSALGPKARLDDVVEAIGGRALAVYCDVTRRKDVENLVRATVDAFGQLDILVNCAATTVGTGPFLEIPEPAWDKTFAVNAKGPFYTMRAAIPEMRKAGGGRIVNVVTSFTGGAGYGAYIASKAALWSMTESVAQEFAPETSWRTRSRRAGWLLRWASTSCNDTRTEKEPLSAKSSGRSPRASHAGGAPRDSTLPT